VVEEGFDLAIRIADLADSSLAARKLAPNRRVVCASPAYLQRHGTPRTPEDLAQHNCLTTTDFAMNWDYRDPDGKPGSMRVTGRYACDNWEVLRDWAVAGLGIASSGRRFARVTASGLYLRYRRGNLCGLSSSASPAREDPCVHRIPR
jgi:DNA-binding transcriptional LysR family regulator